MTAIPINEIFPTIQGEAYYTGSPAVFVRTQGCDVGCPWCDTKHTWAIDHEKLIPFETMVGKTADDGRYALVTVAELVEHVRNMPRLVVLTGGEPCDHDLRELTMKLMSIGKVVQIETSGTRPIRAADWTWVTLSPKVGMAGGYSVRPDALARADEIKMPVGKMADIDTLRGLLRDIPLGINGPPHVWLQPLSQSEKATKLCVEQAMANGWRISIQTHKYLGVR